MVLSYGYFFGTPAVLCTLSTRRRTSLYPCCINQTPPRPCQRHRASLPQWPASLPHASCATYCPAYPTHRTLKGCWSTQRQRPSRLKPRIYQRRPFLIAHQKHFNYEKSPRYISAHGIKTPNTTFHIRKHGKRRPSGVPLSYA